MESILGKIESMNGWKCYPCPNCPILEERIRELKKELESITKERDMLIRVVSRMDKDTK